MSFYLREIKKKVQLINGAKKMATNPVT